MEEFTKKIERPEEIPIPGNADHLGLLGITLERCQGIISTMRHCEYESEYTDRELLLIDTTAMYALGWMISQCQKVADSLLLKMGKEKTLLTTTQKQTIERLSENTGKSISSLLNEAIGNYIACLAAEK